MKITSKLIGNIEIFQLEGTLDHEARETLSSINDKVNNSDADKFLLDLSGISFIDTACIGVIISIYKATLIKSASFALIEPTERVIQHLKHIGVSQRFKTYETVIVAVEQI